MALLRLVKRGEPHRHRSRGQRSWSAREQKLEWLCRRLLIRRTRAGFWRLTALGSTVLKNRMELSTRGVKLC